MQSHETPGQESTALPDILVSRSNPRVVLRGVELGTVSIGDGAEALELVDCTIESISCPEGSSPKIGSFRVISSTIRKGVFLPRLSCSGPLCLTETTVDGPIDIGGADLGQVSIADSVAKDRILLDDSSIEGSAILTDITLDGDLSATGLRTSGALGFQLTNVSISGHLDLSDSRHSGGVEIINSSLNDLSADDINISSRGVDFSNTVISGFFRMKRSRIQGSADYNGLRVKGPADFTDTVFLGWVDLSGSTWESGLDTSRTGGDESGSAQFASGVECREASFHDSWRSNDSHFAGDLILERSSFARGFEFCEVSVDGECSIMSVNLEGTSSLSAASFSGPVTIAGCSFEDLKLLGCEFAGLFLIDEATIDGTLTIEKAVFRDSFSLRELVSRRQAVLAGCVFSGEVSIERCIFHEKMLWEHAEQESTGDLSVSDCSFRESWLIRDSAFTCRKINISGSEFGGQTTWQSVELNVPEITFYDCSFARKLDLRNADFRLENCLSIIRVAGEDIRLSRGQLTGAMYLARIKGSRQERSRRHFRNSDTFHWVRQMFRAGRDYRNEDWALYMHLRERTLGEILELLSPPRKLSRMVSGMWKFISVHLFWRCICGYGIKLTRLVASSALAILLFGSLYLLNPDELIQYEKEFDDLPLQGADRAYSQETPRASIPIALIISASVFFNIGRGAYHVNLLSQYSWMAVLEGLIGLFLLTVFVGSAIRKVLRL